LPVFSGNRLYYPKNHFTIKVAIAWFSFQFTGPRSALQFSMFDHASVSRSGTPPTLYDVERIHLTQPPRLPLRSSHSGIGPPCRVLPRSDAGLCEWSPNSRVFSSTSFPLPLLPSLFFASSLLSLLPPFFSSLPTSLGPLSLPPPSPPFHRGFGRPFCRSNCPLGTPRPSHSVRFGLSPPPYPQPSMFPIPLLSYRYAAVFS